MSHPRLKNTTPTTTTTCTCAPVSVSVPRPGAAAPPPPPPAKKAKTAARLRCDVVVGALFASGIDSRGVIVSTWGGKKGGEGLGSTLDGRSAAVQRPARAMQTLVPSSTLLDWTRRRTFGMSNSPMLKLGQIEGKTKPNDRKKDRIGKRGIVHLHFIHPIN